MTQQPFLRLAFGMHLLSFDKRIDRTFTRNHFFGLKCFSKAVMVENIVWNTDFRKL